MSVKQPCQESEKYWYMLLVDRNLVPENAKGSVHLSKGSLVYSNRKYDESTDPSQPEASYPSRNNRKSPVQYCFIHIADCPGQTFPMVTSNLKSLTKDDVFWLNPVKADLAKFILLSNKAIWDRRAFLKKGVGVDFIINDSLSAKKGIIQQVRFHEESKGYLLFIKVHKVRV